MRFRYSEWDGSEFPTQDRLDFFNNVLDFVMAHGDEALRALDRAQLDEEQRKWLEQLINDGLMENLAGRWRLTPRAINAMQRRALMEIFEQLRAGRGEGHQSQHVGMSGERTDGTRAYEFGDPLSEIEPVQTLRNAMLRSASPISPVHAAPHRKAGGTRQPRIALHPGDIELHQSETQTSVSLVILLDMSGSMSRYGRFGQAKKCAMALHALIRQRYPLDTVDCIGFHSGASIIPEHKLPLTGPKRVTMFDPVIRLRVHKDKIDDAPQHFTNLHMALMLARRLLARRAGDQKQMFIITDGEPTAHVQGDYVHLLYPPDAASAAATLGEALQCSRAGIRISTFALTDDYFGMDWVGFVDQMTRLTRGVAFYCASGDLANCIMESYLRGKRKRSHLG